MNKINLILNVLNLQYLVTFKSSMHPDNLYPHAKYSDRFEPPKKAVESAREGTGFSGVIPPKELTISYRLEHHNFICIQYKLLLAKEQSYRKVFLETFIYCVFHLCLFKPP